MTNNLKINFHFCYPNMSGGIKSCRLLAEEMQRQGADVVIYHPDDPRSYKRSIARKAIDFLKDTQRRLGNSPSSVMKHHLEICEVPVVSCKGNKIRQHHVRQADFDIANFWQQRAWMYEWTGNKHTPGLYVRGHQAGGEENLAKAYAAPGVTLTHATWLQKMLSEKYKARHVILAPNGVDRNQFKFKPRSKNKELTIGFQYATDPRKGADTMFAAYSKIIESNPNVNIISYGSSDASEEHVARFPNWRHYYRPDYETLASLYHDADCWVLPSTHEGLPMPPLEAAASGTPIVATDCGGPEDYITEGESGFIVPVGDYLSMADRIQKILFATNEDWIKMSESSYKNTLAFEWATSAKHLITELEKYKSSHR